LCDEVRDEELPKLGVKIVDDGQNDFYFDSPETLKEYVGSFRLFYLLLISKGSSSIENQEEASAIKQEDEGVGNLETICIDA
jgi:hypothetical protein